MSDIVALGGNTSASTGTDLDSCELFDVDTMEWTNLPHMTTSRGKTPGIVVTYREGCHRVYVFGGSAGDTGYSIPMNSCEFLDIGSDRWTLIDATMSKPRKKTCAVMLDENTVIICGGYGFPYDSCTSCDRFDLTSHTFSDFPKLRESRFEHAAVQYDGTIVVIGGFYTMKTCERFNIVDNKWEPIASLNHGRSDFGACVIEDRIYVVGGAHSIEVYDGSSWAIISFVHGLHTSCRAVCIGHDLVMISEGPTDILTFDPITGKNDTLPCMIQPVRSCIGAVSF